MPRFFNLHFLLFSLLSLFWGIGFLLMKKASFVFGTLTIGGFRVTSGALVIYLFMKYNKTHFDFSFKELLLITPIAFVGSVYPFGIQPYLISQYESAFIAILVSLVPLITMIVSIPILKIYPNRGQMVGVCFGLLCISVLFYDGLQKEITPFDLLLATLIPTGYAVSNILIKKYYNESSPIHVSFLYLLNSSIILLPLGITTEPIQSNEYLWIAIASILTLGICGTGIAFVAFHLLIQARGPLFAGMVTYIIPLIALVLGWADGEQITTTQVVALFGVLISVFLVQINQQLTTNESKS